MTPAEFIALADRAGIPPLLTWLLVSLAIMGALVAGLWKFRRATPNSDRQLLSADQQAFQDRLMKMVQEQDRRITAQTDALDDCQRKHAACEGRVAALEGKVSLLEVALGRATGGHD